VTEWWRAADGFGVLRGDARRRKLPVWMGLGPGPSKRRKCGVKDVSMRYLHTMVRIGNIEQSLDFYCTKLGMQEVRRVDSEAGRYTLIFLAAPQDKDRAVADKAPLLELTFNWDPERYGEGRNFGHLAFEVDDIYATCARLLKAGVTINRPPRDGRMAFVRSPDDISIELLQKGAAQDKKEPWSSMANTGKW
jgi:lactoylglutathione lyase